MARFQKKQGLYKALYSRMALIIFFCFVIFLFFKVVDLWGKDREVTENKRQVENLVHTLEEKQIILETDIAALKTERGQEETIRDKFRVVKDGEELIVIPEEKKEDDSDPSSKKKLSAMGQFFKEWFGK